MKHGKTPTSVGAAGRMALVAGTLLAMVVGNGAAQEAKVENRKQLPARPGPELFTNVYVVPPTFGKASVEGANADPFAAPAHEGGAPVRRRAKEVLEEYGISFAEGSSAIYNPQTSQLIVRQTRDQMELVEAALESLRGGVELQVLLAYQIIESEEPLLEPVEKPEDRKKASEVDPDSGVRRLGEKALKPKPPIPPLLIVGEQVLSDDQVASFLEKVRQEKRGNVRRAAELVVRSGQGCEMWVAEALMEIDPVIGGDNFTVDLNLSMKSGRPDEKPAAVTGRQITIWTGQTAAFEEELGDGRYRTRLVTARLIDPAGLPVKEPSPNLQTRTFRVPGFPTDDPTNREAHEVSGVLEKQGFGLGEKSHAFFNPATDILLVRSSPATLQAIEVRAEEDWRGPKEWPDKQIFFTVKEAVIEGLNAELGWILLEREGENPSPDQERGGGSRRSLPRISGVFTDPQFQVLIRALNSQKGVTLSSAPSILANSGVPCATEVNGRRWGFYGLIGPRGYTVQVKFAAAGPSEKNWPAKLEENETPGVEITLWEGQTIAYSEEIEGEEKTRITFIKAETVEAAGTEVHPPGKKPEGLDPVQQDAVKKADELALRGSQLLADGEITAAAGKFSESVEVLPEHPLTEDRRKAYQGQLERALRKALDASGKRREEPSLFPERGSEDFHAAFEIGAHERLVFHDVFRGETLFDIARKYDISAERLRLVNRLPGSHLTVGDRLLIPVRVKPELPSWERPGELGDSPARRKAAVIILPSVNFRDLPLGDALEFLQEQSVEHDKESPEQEKGIDLILTGADDLIDTRITLKLTNVPLIEALRYTAELANAALQYDGHAVVISPKEEGKRKTALLGEPGYDASDIWFRAYTLLKEGEEAEAERDPGTAKKCFEAAETGFATLRKQFPKFYPELVEHRLQQLRRKLESHADPKPKRDR